MNHEQVENNLGDLDLKLALRLTDLLHEKTDRILRHVL